MKTIVRSDPVDDGDDHAHDEDQDDEAAEVGADA